ncbi:MAG: SH3 domain-containing protein [Bacillota bacterium]
MFRRNRRAGLAALVALMFLSMLLAGCSGRTVRLRPGGPFGLYPAPDPATLKAAMPNQVSGGSAVRVLEERGNWVHVRQKKTEGWIPKWYVSAGDKPVVEATANWLAVIDNTRGFLYPDGPQVVDLDRGRLVKTLWEWNEWLNVRIIAYDVPAVQSAWVHRELLTEPSQVEPTEGFLAKGTEVWYNQFADPSNATMIVQEPGGSELTAFPMAVRVIGHANEDQKPIIKVSGAGGWSGWTLQKNLVFTEPDAGQ